MDDLTEISDKFDEVKNIRNKINISFGEIDAKIASLKLITKMLVINTRNQNAPWEWILCIFKMS